MNELITVGEIANLLRVKRWKVYSIKGLFGDPVIVGTTYLYRRDRVLDVLNQAAALARATTMPNADSLTGSTLTAAA